MGIVNNDLDFPQQAYTLFSHILFKKDLLAFIWIVDNTY